VVFHHIGLPGLAFLRAVDPADADALRVLNVEHVNRVAVEDGDDGASEVRCEYG